MSTLPTAVDVISAMARIRPVVHRTPIMTSGALDILLDCRLALKCEHLQKTGSFKFRGATNAVGRLAEDCPGVATHSSGNHGAALAAAATRLGIPAHIVIPDNAVEAKVRAVLHYGGTVHRCEPTQEAREAGLARLVESGLEPVPPYDHAHVIAGQGTVGLEMLEQIPDLDLLVAPVGGGGLLAGLALAVDGRIPVLGAEPVGANDTARSLAAGSRVEDHRPETMADGLRALVGVRNLAIIRHQVEQVLTVSEDGILRAMELIWTRTKQIVEPSAAVPVAAVLEHPGLFAGRNTGVVLTGGNVDFGDRFAEAGIK